MAMAMAMALSCSSSATGLTLPARASAFTSSLSTTSAQWTLTSAPFSGYKVALDSQRPSRQNNIVTISPFSAAARTLITNAVADAPEAEVSSAEETSKPSITTLKSEADLIKKKVKRDELRRKRLVRKRKLRKKGRWPPSKMAKLKNV